MSLLVRIRAWWLRRRLAHLTAEWDKWQQDAQLDLDLLRGARIYRALQQVNQELQGLEKSLK